MRTASRSGFRTGTVVTTDDRNWELRYTLSRAALQPEPGGGDRHGIGDRRRPGLPLPRALRDPAVRLRQAAPRRAEAARPGQRLLRAGDQPAPPDRHRDARPSSATKATASTAASCAASTSRRCVRTLAVPSPSASVGHPAQHRHRRVGGEIGFGRVEIEPGIDRVAARRSSVKLSPPEARKLLIATR